MHRAGKSYTTLAIVAMGFVSGSALPKPTPMKRSNRPRFVPSRLRRWRLSEGRPDA